MSRAREQYEPALDGLRGVAVAGVFLFHCGMPWMAGGFLGVSTFFTLSGHLITTLLLSGWDRSARVDIGRFWERRIRRLVPALVLAVAFVVALAPWLADAGQRRKLAGDALASLFYVANWHFAASGTSYADLFRQPSPLLHCWSLSIEGQFYLVFPLAVWAALRLGGPRGVAALVVALIGLSLAATAAGSQAAAAFDRVYYGTDTRAVELLLGALLAVHLAGRRTGAPAVYSPALAWIGALSLVAQIVAWSTTSMQTAWVVEGGLAVYALASAAIVRAALEPRGPVRTLLAWAPLRRLGVISYGVYLFHWPIVLWLTPERIGLAAPAVHVLRAAVTIVLAELSYRLLESRVRAGRLFAGRTVFSAALAGTVLVAIVARALPAPPPDALDEAVEAAKAPPVVVKPPPSSDLISFTFFGDSSALATARSFRLWADPRTTPPVFWPIPGDVRLGCGIMGAARRSTGKDKWAGKCAEAAWGEIVRQRGKPKLAVVQTGVWETFEHRLQHGDRLRALGDARFDAYLKSAMERIVDDLARTSVVVWVLAPHLVPGGTGHLEAPPPAIFDRARIDRHNALVREVAAARPTTMAVVDLPAVLAALPDGELDLASRPDGVHFTNDASAAMSDRVGPEIFRAYESVLERRAATGQAAAR